MTTLEEALEFALILLKKENKDCIIQYARVATDKPTHIILHMSYLGQSIGGSQDFASYLKEGMSAIEIGHEIVKQINHLTIDRVVVYP